MLLALGCSATLFVVLLFGRGLWSLLGRWSGWQTARAVPRALRDLQAERDGLKAEKAMMASKLETTLSDMKLRLAEQMAEVSRNRNRLLDAGGKLQMQSEEIDKLKSEIAKRDDKIGALNTQIEENVKAISHAWAKTADHESDAARAAGMHKEAITAVNIREDRIRNLEGEAKALREIIAAFLPGKDTRNIGTDMSKDLHVAASQASLPQTSPPQTPRSRPSLTQTALAMTRSLLADVAENVTVLPAPATNNFQARFKIGATGNPLAPIDTETDIPLGMPEPVNDEPVSFTREAETAGSLERGITNVLSLAERVRGLQKDMKK
jgi:hypothetical protein